MSKVNNKEVLHRIADKSRKVSKGRNLVSVLAIVLTTLLFTSVFTVGGSIITKFQEDTMRQVGGSAHAGYKYLTQVEYDILKEDPWIKDISYRIIVGTVANDNLIKEYTEVGYYEEQEAKFSFCYPEVGKMPEEELEIVTSDLVLKRLGIECELGAKVPLIIDVGGKMVEEEFVLSGYFTGDFISMAQVVAVSKAFQEKIAPVKETSVAETGIGNSEDYIGRIMADVNFYSNIALEEQANALTKRCGFPENMQVGINWAYLGNKMDLGMAVTVVVLLLLIIMAGYLIIYNIFYINVYTDIRHYGLLKTIGTTGKQLKRIVKRQAYSLAAMGIPIGLFLGVLVGKILLPYIMREFNFNTSTNTEVELNIGIFAGATLFSFFTVYISCIKPCKMAAKVTPIEALRVNETSITTKKEKRTGVVNPRRMAVQNLKRSRKKVIIVVASLSLALVLLNSISGLIRGFDMDKFASIRSAGDFSVADASLDNVSISPSLRTLDGVTSEFLEALQEQNGVEEIGNIYIGEPMSGQKFTDEDWAKVVERVLKSDAVYEEVRWDAELDMKMTGLEITPESLETYTRELIEGLMKWNNLDGVYYGIDEPVMKVLTNVEGELDWEKFKTGDYVIATRYGLDEEKINYFYPGEKITLYNEAGESRKYEVMAVAEMPYACSFQVYSTFNCNYILPSEEFLDFIEEKQPMRTLINVTDESEAVLEEWFAEYCEKVNPNLDYTSKEKLVSEFEDLKQTVCLVGGVLVVILAVIGIVNFANTMITSILSRKQELAMLEAVGMSGIQQKQMLIWEGLLYAGRTIVIAWLLGVLLNITIIRMLCDALFFATWQFTIWPILLCIPAILMIVIIVPLMCYRNMKKVSVVDRIRSVE